jgi:rhodanese-related sulfurtransferase
MRFLLICTLLFLAGCGTSAQTGKEVNADEFEKGMSGKDIQLLDVRTAGEYRNGHLKGALQANWNNTKEFEERVVALDKSKTVYIYCLSGVRSHDAAGWMRSKGFSNVVELKGGFSSWKAGNKPVEGMSDIKQMTMEEYQLQIKDKQYVLVDVGAEWCPPCKKMEPIINSFLVKKSEVSLLKIDGGVHTDLMKQLQAEGLPSFILLKQGKEVWRYTGVLSEEELAKMWAEKK